MNMKNLKFISALLLVFITQIHCKAQTKNDVVIGTIDSIESKILGEQRKVWVYVPDQGGNEIFSRQRYPVVYLLDGDAHFYSVVGMIQQLSSVNGNMICPKMIVVGIPNTDRTRDLTPTHIDADPPYMDSTFSKTSGGGENFIAFIEKELMPHIEAKYPTEPYKMLIGHSFGGLAVMQTFINHTDLFNAYICIDPSMWWDKQRLLKQTKQVLGERKFEGKSLFLGIANTMDEGMDLTKVQKDTTGETKHIRSILELKTYFENNNQNGLKYSSIYYSEDSQNREELIQKRVKILNDFINKINEHYLLFIKKGDITRFIPDIKFFIDECSIENEFYSFRHFILNHIELFFEDIGKQRILKGLISKKTPK